MTNEVALTADEAILQIRSAIKFLIKNDMSFDHAVQAFKKRFIITAIEENDWNQCKAAIHIGVHRNLISRNLTLTERKAIRKPPKSERNINHDAGRIERISS